MSGIRAGTKRIIIADGSSTQMVSAGIPQSDISNSAAAAALSVGVSASETLPSIVMRLAFTDAISVLTSTPFDFVANTLLVLPVESRFMLWLVISTTSSNNDWPRVSLKK